MFLIFRSEIYLVMHFMDCLLLSVANTFLKIEDKGRVNVPEPQYNSSKSNGSSMYSIALSIILGI